MKLEFNEKDEGAFRFFADSNSGEQLDAFQNFQAGRRYEWFMEKENAKKLSAALKERDAYAEAMSIALKDGIFPNKADTKRKIEEILVEVRTT